MSNRNAATPPANAKVLIAARPGLLSSALQGLLGSIPRIQTVLVTGNPEEALALCRDHQPEIALIDCPPGSQPFCDLARTIRSISPRTRAVILVETQQQFEQMAGTGAVFLHGTPAETLVGALEALLDRLAEEDPLDMF